MLDSLCYKGLTIFLAAGHVHLINDHSIAKQSLQSFLYLSLPTYLPLSGSYIHYFNTSPRIQLHPPPKKGKLYIEDAVFVCVLVYVCVRPCMHQ